MAEWIVLGIGALLTLGGALGVVLVKHPVHAALLLVQTLFGVAVLFVAQGAHFLAAVQVIVYAGAVVVLFLFVIMLIGVDRTEDIRIEPLKGQRPLALVVAAAGLAELLAIFWLQQDVVTAAEKGASNGTNVEQVSAIVFTDYLFAFEITSVLLVIAVVGAVVLARRPARPSRSGIGASASNAAASSSAVSSTAKATS
jgi:NADH-quinone oxidoreductase subunit J